MKFILAAAEKTSVLYRPNNPVTANIAPRRVAPKMDLTNTWTRRDNASAGNSRSHFQPPNANRAQRGIAADASTRKTVSKRTWQKIHLVIQTPAAKNTRAVHTVAARFAPDNRWIQKQIPVLVSEPAIAQKTDPVAKEVLPQPERVNVRFFRTNRVLTHAG
jgi:hypothetical protein